MSRVRVSVVIAARPAVVWAAVRDIESHVEWMTDAMAIRFTTPSRERVGTTFDCDTRIGPLRLVDRMTITAWKPNKAIGVRHVGLVTGSGLFTLQRARHGRTRFTWTEELSFPWWLGGLVGAWLAAPVLRRIWSRNLHNLKALVEGS